MKRVRLLVILVALALCCLTAAVPAALAEQQVCLVINGEIMHMNDEPPYYFDDGQIMVPVRYIAERIGGVAYWDGLVQTAVVCFPDRTIRIQLGNPDIVVNESVVPVTVAPHAINGRTMVPLAFMESCFPAHFYWDPELSMLSIDTK